MRGLLVLALVFQLSSAAEVDVGSLVSTSLDARCGSQQPSAALSCCGANSCPYTSGVCCPGGATCCPSGATCSPQGCILPQTQPQGCACTPATCQTAPCPCPCQQQANMAPGMPAPRVELPKTIPEVQPTTSAPTPTRQTRRPDRRPEHPRKPQKAKDSGKIKMRGDCTVYGEPHINTFDGRRWNWQAPGEWTLFQDQKVRELVNTYFRQAPSSQAVYQTAVAFKSGKQVVTVELTEPDQSNEFIITHNKKKIDAVGSRIGKSLGDFRVSGCLPSRSGSLIELEETLTLAHSTDVKRHRGCVMTVTSRTTNTEVRVQWSSNRQMRHLALEVVVDHTLKHNRKTGGMCGSFDGVATNDLRTKDGKIVTDPAESAPTWQVKSEDSLLFKPPKGTPAVDARAATAAPNLLKLAGGDQRKVNAAEERCSFLRGPLKADCVMDYLKGLGDAPSEGKTEQKIEDQKPKIEIIRPCGQGTVKRGKWTTWSQCQLPLGVGSASKKCGAGRSYRQRDVLGADGSLCGVEKAKRSCRIPCPKHQPPQPPIAEANGPYLGWMGTPLQLLSVGSRDRSGHPLKAYKWDLGDGSSSVLPFPKHNYTKKGNYTVRLTVTTKAGLTEKDNATVVIKDPNENKRRREEMLGGPYYTGYGGAVTLVPRPPQKGDAEYDEQQKKKKEDSARKQNLQKQERGVKEASVKASEESEKGVTTLKKQDQKLQKRREEFRRDSAEKTDKRRKNGAEIDKKKAQLEEKKTKHKRQQEQHSKKEQKEGSNKKTQNAELKKKADDISNRKKKLDQQKQELAAKAKLQKAEAKTKQQAIERSQKALEQSKKENGNKMAQRKAERDAKEKARRNEAARKAAEKTQKSERVAKADEKVAKARAEQDRKAKAEKDTKAAAERKQKGVVESQNKRIAELNAKSQAERNAKDAPVKAARERAAKEKVNKERAGKERVGKERSGKERSGKERVGKERGAKARERGAKWRARERGAKWRARERGGKARERRGKWWRRRRWRRRRGDPHMTTFDGKRFSFQTPGRYIIYQDKHNQETLISDQEEVLPPKGAAKKKGATKKSSRKRKPAKRRSAVKASQRRKSRSLVELSSELLDSEHMDLLAELGKPRYQRRKKWSAGRIKAVNKQKKKQEAARRRKQPKDATWNRDFEFKTRDGIFKVEFKGSNDRVTMSWNGREIQYEDKKWIQFENTVYGDLRVTRNIGAGDRKRLIVRSVRSLTAVQVDVGRVHGKGVMSLGVHVEGYVVRLENNGGLLGVPDGDINNDYTSRTGEISDDFMVTAPTWRVGWKEGQDGKITTKTKLRMNLLRQAGWNEKRLKTARRRCSDAVPARGVMQDDCVLDYLESANSKAVLRMYARIFEQEDTKSNTRLKKECQPRRAQKGKQNSMTVVAEKTWSQWGVCKGSCGAGWRKRWRRMVGILNGNKVDCGYALEEKRCRLRHCEALP